MPTAAVIMEDVPRKGMRALLLVVLTLATCVHSDLTAEFLNQAPAAHLLLTCSTEDLPRGSHVISIALHNGSLSRPADPLAVLTQREGVPMFGNASQDLSRRFLSGVLHKTDVQSSRLQLLLLYHQMVEASTFSCKVSFLAVGQNGVVENRQYEKRVSVPEPLDSPALEDQQQAAAPSAKATTKKPEPESDPTLRAGTSIQQPTVVHAGIPMEVLIIMLVLIGLLVVVVSAFILQKFRRRCVSQPVPYPPQHYVLTGDMAWDERFGGFKGSRPSLHTVGLRSHYSLPRPLQPPPPPPKLQRTISRDSADYAGNERSCLPPAGMTRTFHYTTPYDAIVQDEDGELSLLNTSAHCDVTPALPPELAEPTYKAPRTPRAEAQAQTQGQGHSLYAMNTSFTNSSQ